MGGANFYTITAAIVAALGAIFGTVLTTWLAARRTNREKADDQEISVRAKFVADMVGRVGELEGRIDDAVKRERELDSHYRIDMEALDSRWRHLANNLVFYTQMLVYRLKTNGIEVPPFTGWDAFVAEGGIVRREWMEDRWTGTQPHKSGDEDPE